MRNKAKCAHCGADITLIQISPNKTVLCDLNPILYRADDNGDISVIDIRGYKAKASKVTPYKESHTLDGQSIGYMLHKVNCPNFKGKRK